MKKLFIIVLLSLCLRSTNAMIKKEPSKQMPTIWQEIQFIQTKLYENAFLEQQELNNIIIELDSLKELMVLSKKLTNQIEILKTRAQSCQLLPKGKFAELYKKIIVQKIDEITKIINRSNIPEGELINIHRGLRRPKEFAIKTNSQDLVDKINTFEIKLAEYYRELI